MGAISKRASELGSIGARHQARGGWGEGVAKEQSMTLKKGRQVIR